MYSKRILQTIISLVLISVISNSPLLADQSEKILKDKLVKQLNIRQGYFQEFSPDIKKYICENPGIEDFMTTIYLKQTKIEHNSIEIRGWVGRERQLAESIAYGLRHPLCPNGAELSPKNKPCEALCVLATIK